MDIQEKISVLYLDDEVNNLNSFKATFRFDYNVLLAKNVAEAEEHLNNPENKIKVILSDQRMPEISGVEFFENIRERHPHCVRLLITGFSDIESVIEAVNRGHIFRYIKKPWVELDIKSAIEEAFKFYMATSMLAETNTSLQKAYNELSKFAYSVAHDIKGPVTSIQGALRIIGDELNTGQTKDLLNLTIASANKLESFVDSMFDYYRLNQGELSISDINFDELATYYRELFAVEMQIHQTSFKITVDQNNVFRSDIAKLQIILNNLLNNAFKFLKTGEPGSIKLEITATSEMATLVVSDNGVGIDPKYIDSVFDMFYRATTHAPGSGFGLYNVKDAVTKLDGSISVTSTPNNGSTFTVTIPTK